ncbi:hypothetical protein VH571_03800 [Frondihabitans sp. 4ASC-45]|uniref:hypothetical protein n=1 Tax=Frondihabitans sp. 4ASC-45 TaxID=3111636 RepID=UPI003C1B153C
MSKSPAAPAPQGRRRANMTLTVTGLAVAVFGLVVLGAALLFNHSTSNDGGGANIGAGVLALVGTFIGVCGLVVLLIAAAIALGRRRAH